MDLEGNGPLASGDLGIVKVYHLNPVEPGGNMTAHYTDFHVIPITHLQNMLFFIRDLNQPATTVGFVNPSGIVIGRSHFYLPS